MAVSANEIRQDVRSGRRGHGSWQGHRSALADVCKLLDARIDADRAAREPCKPRH